jgi:hypothetical protein
MAFKFYRNKKKKIEKLPKVAGNFGHFITA